ncbi:MAG: sigma-70 family RNA polymerase sigma factor [Marinicaulis sp.]|nr:sigma-70 family RNA polymerase sigma factor [Marinicaulis sp.]NNE41510.1 sigma-70 family RNA polymerase sigma factor [Marinicaulis sp.]NNL89673.1 sigma-70 family RNA polymerase sigma factor [Marinicaulis sp.]
MTLKDRASATANPASENQSDVWTQEMRAVKEQRDEAAFARLFDHFAPRIKSIVVGAGVPPEMAEEIAQETMITVWRKAEQFDPAKASFSAWVYAISRNKKIDRLRRENKPAPDMEDPAIAPSAPPLADEVIVEAQDAKSLHAALATLPEEQREPILLAFMSGLAHPKVAEKLGVPIGTIKSRIRLGVAKLRTHLREKDLTNE